MKFKSQAFIFHGIGRCVNSDLYLLLGTNKVSDCTIGDCSYPGVCAWALRSERKLEGGREGGQGQSDAVRSGAGAGARDRDDRGVLAGGEGSLGAGVRDAPGAAATGAGSGGGRGHGVGEPVHQGGVHSARSRRAVAGR